MNDELLTDFLEESYDLIERIKNALAGWNTSPDQIESINSIYRWVHTIKGGCSMFEYTATAKVAHELETFLGQLKQNPSQITPDQLMKVTHEVKIIESLMKGNDKGELPEAEVMVPVAAATSSAPLKFHTEYFKDYFERSIHLLEDLTKEGYRFFEILIPNPIADKVIDKLNDHGFVVIENENQDQERAVLCALNALEGDQQIKKAEELIARFKGHWNKPQAQETITAIETPKSSPTPISTNTATPSSGEVLRVPLQTVNGILNNVWELFLVRNQMAHLFNENIALFKDHHSFIQQFEALDTVLERNIHDLESKTMSLRLSPIKKVFSRMEKVVTDYCSQNGKKIKFETSGEGIDLDKKVLDMLNEPLIHLVRNAIDHGIEDSQTRVSNGKTPEGTVQLVAQLLGNEVKISLSDDGKGINAAKILESAKNKNLDISSVKDDNDAINPIFMPGFSTAEKVTDVSGRGVGMDAVKKSIQELGGDVSIQTKVGKGSTFTITLPLSMSVSKSLIIKVRDLLYALSTKSIIFVERISVHSLKKNGPDYFYTFNDELIPCLDLALLFPDYRPQTDLPITHANICVTNLQGSLVAFKVDEVVQTLNVVMKPLPKFVNKGPFISGVSILPGGSPIFVLNIHECMKELRRIGANNDRKTA